MVRVCDAIMGSGKTSADDGYINAHPEKKVSLYHSVPPRSGKN